MTHVPNLRAVITVEVLERSCAGQVPWWPCPRQWDTLHPLETWVLPLAGLGAKLTQTPQPLCLAEGELPQTLGFLLGRGEVTTSVSPHPSFQCIGDKAQPRAEGAAHWGAMQQH